MYEHEELPVWREAIAQLGVLVFAVTIGPFWILWEIVVEFWDDLHTGNWRYSGPGYNDNRRGDPLWDRRHYGHQVRSSDSLGDGMGTGV